MDILKNNKNLLECFQKHNALTLIKGPILLLTFLITYSTRLFQLKLESMKIPKYLMEESRSRVQLLIVSEILWVSIFLCRGWNITYT
jgi:hypothetical protein